MDIIKKLIDLFAKFPTVGPRTASRFVFYLINEPKEKIDELVLALQELKKNIKFCGFCFQPSEGLSEKNLCAICADSLRNKQLLCIVEKENDLLAIENTKKYKGLYFILGGTLTIRKDDGAHLRIKQLQERIKDPKKFGLPDQTSFTEIIIAINPTPEGRATSVLVERSLKELSRSQSPDKVVDSRSNRNDRGSSMASQSGPQTLKITHLANGLPFGGELEYADQETLESAFEGRK